MMTNSINAGMHGNRTALFMLVLLVLAVGTSAISTAQMPTETPDELVEFFGSGAGAVNGAEADTPEVDNADEKEENGALEGLDDIVASERITITLDDVSLEDTVRMFAQTTSANIIASGALLADKRVTVNLTDVDWRPALRSILEIHDLELQERSPGSGVYSIRVRMPDAPVPTLVKTFFLKYTTTSEVRASISSILRPGSTIDAFPSRNALVIRATETNLGEVEELIETLDRPGRQVLIEARILELTDEARKAVGIDWSVLEGYQVGITDVNWLFQNNRSRQRTSQERGMEYDYRGEQGGRSQFRDETGAVIPGANVDYDSWGTRPDFEGALTDVSWDGTPGSYNAAERGRGAAYESLSDRVSLHDYSDVLTAILSPGDFSVVLSALQRTDGVSIVSNPKMIVTSGSTNAFFSVGEREPIIETEIQRGTEDSPGDREIARLATDINTEFIRQGYLETGIDLRVVATVKTDDYIEADIRPSLRRTIDFKAVGGNSWPIISVKEIDTSFTLRSGQTVAIGGLTGVEDGKITKRVPILGSIPIIGRFFRHEADTQSQTETIIFVTLSVADPDILENDAAVPIDSRLVHSRLLEEQARREEWLQQMAEYERSLELQSAEEDEAAPPADLEPEAMDASPAASDGPVPIVQPPQERPVTRTDMNRPIPRN
jgi:type IV pilus assembly protein PilQ